MSKILVIGSINVDFVVETKVRPLVGETVIGDKLIITHGGKGANQAVAAARFGANVSMIGKIGDDFLGKDVLKNLNDNHVNTENIEVIKDIETGSAHITLCDGDNNIIVIPAANNYFEKNFIKKYGIEILKSDIVLLQNEIPAFVVEEVIEFCFKNKIKTIYNPAPVRAIDFKTLLKATYITPNQHEFEMLFENETLDSALLKYPGQLIITLGANGVVFSEKDEIIKISAHKVDVIDTTGAGDTFNGALALFALNHNLKQAVKLANIAAALSIREISAQAGMPSLKMVEKINLK